MNLAANNWGEMVAVAAPGSAEWITSGRGMAPDIARINKKDGRIKEETLGSGRLNPVLTDGEVAALADIAGSFEVYFGHPLLFKFSIGEDGNIYVFDMIPLSTIGESKRAAIRTTLTETSVTLNQKTAIGEPVQNILVRFESDEVDLNAVIESGHIFVWDYENDKPVDFTVSVGHDERTLSIDLKGSPREFWLKMGEGVGEDKEGQPITYVSQGNHVVLEPFIYVIKMNYETGEAEVHEFYNLKDSDRFIQSRKQASSPVEKTDRVSKDARGIVQRYHRIQSKTASASPIDAGSFDREFDLMTAYGQERGFFIDDNTKILLAGILEETKTIKYPQIDQQRYEKLLFKIAFDVLDGKTQPLLGVSADETRELLAGNEIHLEADDGAVFKFTHKIGKEDDRFDGQRHVISVFHDHKLAGHVYFRENRNSRDIRIYERFDDSGYYYYNHPDNARCCYEDWNWFSFGPDGGFGIEVFDGVRNQYQGIGTTLMALAVRIGQLKGLNKIEAAGVRAQEFFASLNFIVSSSREFSTGIWIDMLYPIAFLKIDEYLTGGNLVPGSLGIRLRQHNTSSPLSRQGNHYRAKIGTGKDGASSPVLAAKDIREAYGRMAPADFIRRFETADAFQDLSALRETNNLIARAYFRLFMKSPSDAAWRRAIAVYAARARLIHEVMAQSEQESLLYPRDIVSTARVNLLVRLVLAEKGRLSEQGQPVLFSASYIAAVKRAKREGEFAGLSHQFINTVHPAPKMAAVSIPLKEQKWKRNEKNNLSRRDDSKKSASLPRDARYDFAGAWFSRSSLQGKILRVHSNVAENDPVIRRMEIDLMLSVNPALVFALKGFPSGEITVVINTDEREGVISSLVIEPSIQFPLWYSQELLRVLYRWLRDDRGYRIVVHNVYKRAQDFFNKILDIWDGERKASAIRAIEIDRIFNDIRVKEYVIHLDRLNENLYQPFMPDSGASSSSGVREEKRKQYLSLLRQRLMRRMPGRAFIVFDEQTGTLSGDRHITVLEEESLYLIAQIAFRLSQDSQERRLMITAQFVVKNRDEKNYRRQGIATSMVAYLLAFYQPVFLVMENVNKGGLAFMIDGLDRQGLVRKVREIENRQRSKDAVALAATEQAINLLSENDQRSSSPLNLLARFRRSRQNMAGFPQKERLKAFVERHKAGLSGEQRKAYTQLMAVFTGIEVLSPFTSWAGGIILGSSIFFSWGSGMGIGSFLMFVGGILRMGAVIRYMFKYPDVSFIRLLHPLLFVPFHGGYAFGMVRLYLPRWNIKELIHLRNITNKVELSLYYSHQDPQGYQDDEYGRALKDSLNIAEDILRQQKTSFRLSYSFGSSFTNAMINTFHGLRSRIAGGEAKRKYLYRIRSAEFNAEKIRRHLAVQNTLVYIDTPQRIQRLAYQIQEAFGHETLFRVYYYDDQTRFIEKLVEKISFEDMVREEFMQIEKKLSSAGDIVAIYGSARLKSYLQTIRLIFKLIRRWIAAVAALRNPAPITEKIKNQIRTARFQNKTYRLTERIAAGLAWRGYSVITGGGPGIMEAANRGARAAIKNGARVQSIGLNIDLPFEQQSNGGVTLPLWFSYFFTRKFGFYRKSMVDIAMPGGLGTLDEIYEVLSIGKKMIFVDKDFYGGFIEALREEYRQGGHRFNPDELMILVDTEEEAWDAVEQIVAEVKGKTAPHLLLKFFDIQRGLASLGKGMEKVSGLSAAVPTVGVFGSKSVAKDSVDFGVMKAVSQILSALGYSIISRGDNGISQAVHAGFIPSNGNRHIVTFRIDGEADGVHLSGDDQETIYVDSQHLFEQKVVFLKAARNGLVTSMGGRGTMDLLFEVLTLLQTGKIKGRPVVLVGKEKWIGLFRWIADQFVTNGTINKEDLDLVQFADTPQEIVAAILPADGSRARLSSEILLEKTKSSSPIFKQFSAVPVSPAGGLGADSRQGKGETLRDRRLGAVVWSMLKHPKVSFSPLMHPLLLAPFIGYWFGILRLLRPKGGVRELSRFRSIASGRKASSSPIVPVDFRKEAEAGFKEVSRRLRHLERSLRALVHSPRGLAPMGTKGSYEITRKRLAAVGGRLVSLIEGHLSVERPLTGDDLDNVEGQLTSLRSFRYGPWARKTKTSYPNRVNRFIDHVLPALEIYRQALRRARLASVYEYLNALPFGATVRLEEMIRGYDFSGQEVSELLEAIGHARFNLVRQNRLEWRKAPIQLPLPLDGAGDVSGHGGPSRSDASSPVKFIVGFRRSTQNAELKTLQNEINSSESSSSPVSSGVKISAYKNALSGVSVFGVILENTFARGRLLKADRRKVSLRLWYSPEAQDYDFSRHAQTPDLAEEFGRPFKPFPATPIE
jgi:predicted Rossmann-fold nucleotide-binding protein